MVHLDGRFPRLPDPSCSFSVRDTLRGPGHAGTKSRDRMACGPRSVTVVALRQAGYKATVSNWP